MIIILHGENALQRRELLAAVVARSGLSPDFGEINTETLTESISAGELRRACLAIPFLGDVRVVIVREALAKLKGDEAQAVAELLPDVPPTTWLIFDEGHALPKKHPVLSAAVGLGAEVTACGLPDTRDLPQWIRQRVERYGGKIDSRAAALLAQNIGANLLLLDQEIQKLLLYVWEDTSTVAEDASIAIEDASTKVEDVSTKIEDASITVEDVNVMVPYIQSADVIFQMVDALGQRDARLAATHLHRLLDVGEHPLAIFGMVVRQFRLLIQVRWMSDRRQTQPQIVSHLKLHPYVVSKVYSQAARFSAVQLREAYRLLYRTDVAIKRGEMPADMALDLLVAQLTRI